MSDSDSETPDIELPGMWEKADFTGGADEMGIFDSYSVSGLGVQHKIAMVVAAECITALIDRDFAHLDKYSNEYLEKIISRLDEIQDGMK